MAELHIIGEIREASDFGSDSVFCRYSIQAGPNWTLISGDSEGQTLSGSPLYEGASVWSHPLDLHFVTKGIQGWPKILVQVHCFDSLGRSWLKGYGTTFIPSLPGFHELKLPCWKPTPSGTWEKLSEYFHGGSHQLVQPDTLFSNIDRCKLVTESTGFVTVQIYIIVRNLSKVGVEYK